MNLGKIKTFLIVLFLGINIYLVFSLFMTTRFFADKKTVEHTADILYEFGVEIDKNTVPKYVVNLKNIDTSNAVYTDTFKSVNKNGMFIVRDGGFTCRKKNKDIGKKTDKAIKKEVEDFLAGYGFNTGYMKFGEITKASEDRKFNIYCYAGGYRIFDSIIKVAVSEDEFTLNGTWYEPLTNKVKSRSRSRDTVYITSILINMVHNDSIMKNAPFKITDIDYGYLAGTSYGKGAHVRTSALPYYKLKDNKGNVYYYDAKNGTYLK